MDQFLNLNRLTTGELFSELAFYGYLADGQSEQAKGFLQFTTGARILHELYCRFTEKDKIIAALRADVVQKVALYTKKNPNANSDEQAREIKRLVDDFAVKVTLVKNGLIA